MVVVEGFEYLKEPGLVSVSTAVVPGQYWGRNY